MTDREKAFYGLLLLALWAAFAWFGKTDTGGLISAIEAILAGLGLYHFNRTRTAQPPPNSPPVTSTSTAPPPAPPST